MEEAQRAGGNSNTLSELIEAEILVSEMKSAGLSCFETQRERDIVQALFCRVGSPDGWRFLVLGSGARGLCGWGSVIYFYQYW